MHAHFVLKWNSVLEVFGVFIHGLNNVKFTQIGQDCVELISILTTMQFCAKTGTHELFVCKNQFFDNLQSRSLLWQLSAVCIYGVCL